ncbi:hypothetical protein Vqi01_29270 [Micromonospora qiuiae]|uniref:Uncharacterized protein n=1 Tax=Micromonospora qiuiae TaxID=502268 RepID=A0ABQ4JC73_9ACTN|nr:hypothetical protein [Micromonospora qiuiae]GIJ27765.1 hypothetical protein Vqi01_29270 [Micromonospora qiuiae]
MARVGWGGSIATAAGVAAGAGAAQLGFGYGLGILNWAPAETTASTATWVASLIWATWIAATSTIFGAVCAQRLHDRRFVAASPAQGPGAGRRDGGSLWWGALSGAAALGALITVLLVAVPARVAVVPDTPSPRDMAAAYAALGVLVGALVALWALRCRAAATNIIATAGWLWLLAVVAVVDSVLAGRGLTTAQLGIWQLSSGSDQFWIRDYFYWPGAVLSLGSALLIGALAARAGVRDADRRVGATASGAAGPLLVAVAYFLAVPRLTAISPEQVSAHLIAPYAVIVGIGGSVLVAALAQRSARRATSRPDPGAATAVPRQRTGDHDTPGTDPVTAVDTPAVRTDPATPTGPGAGGTATGSAGRRRTPASSSSAPVPAAPATRGARSRKPAAKATRTTESASTTGTADADTARPADGDEQG